MESRILILFCTLLSLFLFFSAASALWMGIRRRGRLPAAVWGVLFLLPLLPFSPLLEGASAVVPVRAPVRLVLTVNAAGERVLSLCANTPEPAEVAPRLALTDTGTIRLLVREEAETPPVTLPEGITVPGRLWDAGIFFLTLLLFLWGMIAAAHVVHRVCVYMGNIHFLTSRSAICRDERVEAVFAHAAAQVKLLRKPVLRVVEPGIALSPCTAGFLTPAVYISHRQAALPADTLEYVFLHELCHVKRHDFLTRLLGLLTTSVYAFSPLAGAVRRQVNEDCELGCDRLVLAYIGQNRRDRYLEAILTIAEEMLVRPGAAPNRTVVSGELFSFASGGGAKELLLRRFKALRQAEVSASVGRLTAAVAVLCLLHGGMFALADTAPMADPLVDLESGYLETVLREYYDLPDTVPLQLSHLAGIHSLEFSLSRKLDRDHPLLSSADAERTLALTCLVNEGKYPLSAGAATFTGPVLDRFGMQEWLADGVTPTYREQAEASIPLPQPLTEPLWLDRDYGCAVDLLPDVCPLSTLARYLPTDRVLCERILQHYTCLDGTEEALDRYTTALYKGVIEAYDLSADAPEVEITDAFVRYCGERGISLDPDRGDLLTQLYEARQAEILAISPAALLTPMVFRNPALAEETVEELTVLLLEEGVTSSKLLTDMVPDATGRFTLPFGDLVLFENLRTVVLDDRLTLGDGELYASLTGRRCSVVEK